MRYILLLILSVFLLSGCSYVSGPWQSFQVEGAKITDGALEAGEWEMCTAASIGAIRRRYGNNKEMADAWQLFCWEVWDKESGAQISPLDKPENNE